MRAVLIALGLIGAVAAVVVIVASQGGGNDEGQPAALKPSVPTGLRVLEQSGLDVTLAWEVDGSGAPVRAFVVFRDGEKVAKLPGGRTSFVDKGLDPGTSYSYSVAAFAGGTLSQQSEAFSVQIPAMSLSDARFGGSWTIGVRYTEAHGYSNVHAGKRETDWWSFAPVCNEGACDTKLRDSLSGPAWNVILERNGTVYSASSTEQLSTCQFTPVMGDLFVRLRVTRADVVDGRWRATRFVGIVRGSEGSKSVGLWYCSSSGFSGTLTGSLSR